MIKPPKILLLICVLLLSHNAKGQIDPAPVDRLDCDAHLAFLSNALMWDTLGGKGVKLAASEYIVDHGCTFVGRPMSDVVGYYGKPDVEHEWTTLRTEEHAFLYRYKLFTSTFGDKYTFGDKWLDVSTNVDLIITKFVIFTVDE